MMQHKSKCSRKLSEYLQELARKEDLELLRVPLRDFDLFPPDKDAASAAITMEELKKLVRHWKLHEARGFWKTHPTKEDLVSALLEYIDDKEDYARKPTRPSSAKPTKERLRTKGRQHVDLSTFRVNCFKPYSGDLFSHRDHTDGLIYLSRQSIRNSNVSSKTPAAPKSSRSRHNAFLSSEFLGVDLNKISKAVETEEQLVVAERQRTQWHAIAVEIFRYSMEPGDELDIINEGALQVIEKINHGDQATASLANLEMATYCAATLLNLAAAERDSDECRALLMPPHELIVPEALNVISTHHSTDPLVMLLCASTLGYLTVPFGGEDALVATCLATLGAAVAVDSTICRKAAMATLANLFVASERNQMVEHVLPAIKALTAVNEIESALLVLCTIYNLSFYDMPRITLVEGGTVASLVSVLSAIGVDISVRGDFPMNPSKDPIIFDSYSALHMLAECVLNLSCTIDARERMIKDGAVSILVEVDEMVEFTKTKEIVGLGLANFTVSEVADLLDIVVEQGAVRALVSLTNTVEATEARHRIATAFCNLSAEPLNRHVMMEEQTHKALVTLSNTANAASSCQSLILVAFINLLSVSENQCAIVDAGLLPLLERLSTKTASEEVKRYCGMALANIADDLSLHKTATHQTVIAMMTKLASSSDIELQRIIASAFAMFAYILTGDTHSDSSSEPAQLTDDVIGTILELSMSPDMTVLKFTGITLNNLSQEQRYHDALFRNNVAGALLRLADSRDDEVRRMCASTVHSLTSSGKLDANGTAVVEGFIKVLAALENSRSADVINYCAAALFSISCMQAHVGLLTTQATVLWRLFGMMRGGQESTQLYAARALCNLTCDESCVRTLLAQKAIADFVAIAILRTNNEEVKGVCAECLFNLIRYDAFRAQLLREPNNVLWAISRLFRFCTESERTQTIGALVVYNLSCAQPTAASMMKTINAAEALTAVAMHDSAESQRWATDALCNLSWTPDFAAQLVHDASACRPHAENGVSGVVQILLLLADSELPEDQAAHVIAQCATALYNMSLCSEEVRERLVEDGVPVFLKLLLDSDDDYIVELACVVCYNISLAPGCETALVDYQVAGSLIKLLRRLVPAPKPASKGLPRPGFPTDKETILLLIEGTLFNLTVKIECRAALEACGVSDACIAVGQLAATPPAHIALVAAMMQNLTWEAETHRPLVSRGVAFIDMLSCLVASSSEPSQTVLIDIANMLCNLSSSTSLGSQLGDIGVIDLLAQLIVQAEGSEEILNLCATAARNLSHVEYREKDSTLHPSWLKPEVEAMMMALGTLNLAHGSELTESHHARLDDVAACLYNVLTLGGSELGTADGLSSILTALFKQSERPATRSLCASALLARQNDSNTAHFSDGSVSALHLAMQAEIAAYDAEIIATPKPLRQDKRDQKPGISPEILGASFSLLQPDKPTIAYEQVVRRSTEPDWKPWKQDATSVAQGLEVPATQSTKLPKQPASPPRTTYTKTSGSFKKILFLRAKVGSEIDKARASSPSGDRPESPDDFMAGFDFMRMFPRLD